MPPRWKDFFSNLRHPDGNFPPLLSKIASVLRVRNEALDQRVTGRVFEVHKNTVAEWEEHFVEQQAPLMFYVLCHELISLMFEGDELYAIIGQRVDACDSQAWMERINRFIVVQHGGQQDTQMVEDVINTLVHYVEPFYPTVSGVMAMPWLIEVLR